MTSTPAPRPVRTRPRWPFVVLAVAVVVVGVPLVAGGIFLWSFSGGWDGIRPAAQPTDGRVVGAREASADRARSLHDDAVDAVLEASGGTVLADAETDSCREGQNNWKIQDGYTLSCTRTAATAVQLPGQASVEEAAGAVDEALLARGWTASSFTLEPAGADEAVLRYGDRDDSSLEVGVSTLGYTPVHVPDPVFADWTDGGSDGPDVAAAYEGGTGVRVLLVNEVTYFED